MRLTKEQRRNVCGLMREFREKRCLSIPKMALLMGVTDRQIQYWERETYIPGRRMIEAFRRLQEAFEGSDKRDVGEILTFSKTEEEWRARKLQQLRGTNGTQKNSTGSTSA